MAAFVRAHPNRIYLSDSPWNGRQRYALYGDRDGRFTREERDAQIGAEGKLTDDQEERWRAYLISREIVREAVRKRPGPPSGASRSPVL
jgi:hypothetical protein